ncbi:uncharacterized protein BXZ73DRAFT_47769, partial [Epithele typhae]|uniref:uncharacterized protein n=1 Tax=Epithele typhae TaxID=378194 RepID=UPI0020086D0F
AVECERIFSSSKETITPRRNHLTADVVEALQVLKYGFNHSVLVSYAISSEDEETRLMKEDAEVCDIEHA